MFIHFVSRLQHRHLYTVWVPLSFTVQSSYTTKPSKLIPTVALLVSIQDFCKRCFRKSRLPQL